LKRLSLEKRVPLGAKLAEPCLQSHFLGIFFLCFHPSRHSEATAAVIQREELTLKLVADLSSSM
jgi:hypothetical protein